MMLSTCATSKHLLRWHHFLSCSATIKAQNHETLVRTKDYKNVVKQQERNIRRLKRQLHTYEALATTKHGAVVMQSTDTFRETVHVEGGTDYQAVTKETMKGLLEQGKASRTRITQLETQLAAANEHNKVWMHTNGTSNVRTDALILRCGSAHWMHRVAGILC
jgi:hypothetical protein